MGNDKMRKQRRIKCWKKEKGKTSEKKEKGREGGR